MPPQRRAGRCGAGVQRAAAVRAAVYRRHPAPSAESPPIPSSSFNGFAAFVTQLDTTLAATPATKFAARGFYKRPPICLPLPTSTWSSKLFTLPQHGEIRHTSWIGVGAGREQLVRNGSRLPRRRAGAAAANPGAAPHLSGAVGRRRARHGAHRRPEGSRTDESSDRLHCRHQHGRRSRRSVRERHDGGGDRRHHSLAWIGRRRFAIRRRAANSHSGASRTTEISWCGCRWA